MWDADVPTCNYICGFVGNFKCPQMAWMWASGNWLTYKIGFCGLVLANMPTSEETIGSMIANMPTSKEFGEVIGANIPTNEDFCAVVNFRYVYNLRVKWALVGYFNPMIYRALSSSIGSEQDLKADVQAPHNVYCCNVWRQNPYIVIRVSFSELLHWSNNFIIVELILLIFYIR